MNINELAKMITKLEGGKKEVSIAQVKEILSIINEISNGLFYKLVRVLL